MKNNTAKWLALTLMISLSVLCFAVYSKYYGEKDLWQDTGTHPSADADESDDSPDDGQKPSDEDDTPPEDETEQGPYYNEFPREASIKGDILVQNVGGDADDLLKEVHKFGGKYYLIIQTASDGYDIKSDANGISVAVLDQNLRLESVLRVSGETDETFLYSKLTAEGIIVAANGSDYTKLYKISFASEKENSLYLNKFYSTDIYYKGDRLFVFGAEAGSLSVTVTDLSLNRINSSSTPAEGRLSLKGIFPAGNGFNLAAVSDADKTYFFNYTPNTGLNVINIMDKTSVMQIIPFRENGTNMYAAILSDQSGLNLVKTDASFETLLSRPLAEGENALLIPIGGNYMTAVFKDGESCESKVFCSHFDEIISLDIKIRAEKVSALSPGGEGAYLTAVSEGKVILYFVNFYEAKILYSYDGGGDYAFFDGNTAFISSSSDGNEFSDNFGRADVFALRPVAPAA